MSECDANDSPVHNESVQTLDEQGSLYVALKQHAAQRQPNETRPNASRRRLQKNVLVGFQDVGRGPRKYNCKGEGAKGTKGGHVQPSTCILNPQAQMQNQGMKKLEGPPRKNNNLPLVDSSLKRNTKPNPFYKAERLRIHLRRQRHCGPRKPRTLAPGVTG